MVNDSNTWAVAGKRLSEILLADGFESVETILVEKGAVKEEVDKARNLAKKLGPCAILGVGGGVNLDIAKATASLEKLRCVVLPTIFAADAMTGTNSVFRAERVGVDGKSHQADYAFRVGPPDACVVDIGIIMDAPWRFQAAGFADYIAKTCAVADWKMAYSLGKEANFSDYAMNLALSQTEYLIKNASRIRNKEKIPFRAFLQSMMNDGFLTQMAGSSRILFGSEHAVGDALMEEQLKSGYIGLHGDRISIGIILMARLHGLDWQRLRSALLEVGCPVTAKEIGLGDEAVERALIRARTINEDWLKERSDIYTILMEKGLDQDSGRRIAQETKVIE